MSLIVKTYAARLCLAIITFTTNVIIARKLGASELGSYALIMTIALLCSQLFATGLDSALLYFSSKLKAARSNLYSIAFKHALVACLIFALIATVFAFIDIYPLKLSALVTALLFSQMMQSFVIAIKTGEGKLLYANKVLLVCHSLLLLAVTFVIPHDFHSASTFAFLYLLTALCIVIKLSINRFSGKDKSTEVEIRELYQYAKKSFIGNISGALRLRIQVILLSIFSTSAVVGMYSVAQAITESMFILPVMLSSLMISAITSLESSSQKAAFIRYLKLSLYSGLGLFIAVFITAPFLIPIIYGEAYSDVVPILSTLAMSLVFFCFNKICLGFLFAINRPELCSRAEFIAMLTVAILSTLLAATYGALGVATAAVCSGLVLSCLLIHYIKQTSQIQLSELLFITKQDIQFVVSKLQQKQG